MAEVCRHAALTMEAHGLGNRTEQLRNVADQLAAAPPAEQARPDEPVEWGNYRLKIQHSEPVPTADGGAVASEAYDRIDRYLRNSLTDDDYAEYSEALETVYTNPAPAPAPDVALEGKPTEPGIYAVAGFHIGHPDDHAIVEVIERVGGELYTNLHRVNSERDEWTRMAELGDHFRWYWLASPFTAAQPKEEG